MNISFVIPAYNEEQGIGACLDSILQHAPGREIIVVDNASTDRTAAISSNYPKVRTVSEVRKGIGYARQCGLQEASGDLVAFIDADVRLRAGWLDIVGRVFEQQPGVVALTGPYRYHDGPTWRRVILTVGGYYGQLFGYWSSGTMVIGGNLVARKRALQAMGGFSPAINFYAQDPDVARRIKRQGKVLFRRAFFVDSSSRRYDAEGLIATTLVYLVNHFWIFLFHRPFSKSHRDIRSDHGQIHREDG